MGQHSNIRPLSCTGAAITQETAVESRITELEIKISYTEDMVDELNRTVYRQQQQIDLLIAQIRALRDQVQTAQPSEQQHSLRDEIPPHY